ncbi:MAG TPA: methionyl aminopeptidase, partial [Chlamydiales bacterium]|nr:methionyl aminopeptidase [Chlamydiales bacterium]
ALASRLTANLLKQACAMAKEGVTTLEINHFVEAETKKAKARPAPLGYGNPPYPAATCISLNEVVCHGIPDKRPLQNGDILNIDISCELNGFYGDCSAMVMIGDVSEEKKRVVETAKECLMRAISICKPGALICQIGEAITDYATSQNCSVVHQFVGHGCGIGFHEEPQIPHCRNNIKIPLAEGMTFTIEPMINAGVAESIIDPHDKWTARTADGKPSAQWEHLLVITSGGCQILTIPD